MGLPDILKVHEITVQMMYVACLVGFSPGVLEFWLTKATSWEILPNSGISQFS